MYVLQQNHNNMVAVASLTLIIFVHKFLIYEKLIIAGFPMKVKCRKPPDPFEELQTSLFFHKEMSFHTSHKDAFNTALGT